MIGSHETPSVFGGLKQVVRVILEQEIGVRLQFFS